MRAQILVPMMLVGVSSIAVGQDTWSGSIGMAALSAPSYPGSNQYRVSAAPIVQLEYKNFVYIGGSAASATGGIGVRLLRSPSFTLSTEIGGSATRPEGRGDGLAGMGRRDGATMLTTIASYRLGALTASGGMGMGLNSDVGTVGTLTLESKHAFGSRWIASLSTGTTFADKSNMAFDFGVSSAQALRRQALIDAGDPRLSTDEGGVYTPGAGIKEMQVSGMLGYVLSRRTTAVLLVRGSRLGHEAAESPLTRTRNGITTGVGLTYGF
jgi:outer membrane scaffolding protein for murein synthesis (MipA/OmpV family)